MIYVIKKLINFKINYKNNLVNYMKSLLQTLFKYNNQKINYIINLNLRSKIYININFIIIYL